MSASSKEEIRILPAHILKIKYILYLGNELTTWESVFMDSIKGKYFLSCKQVEKLGEIYEGLRFGRQFSFSEISETWQDVHDFDRL